MKVWSNGLKFKLWSFHIYIFQKIPGEQRFEDFMHFGPPYWPYLKKNQMSWPIIPPLFLLGTSHSIGLNWLEQINSTCQLQDGCIWHNNVDLKLVWVLIPCLPECNCIVVHTTSLDSRKMYVTYNEKLINKRFFKN